MTAVERLAWDSEHFGFEVARIDASDEAALAAEVGDCRANGVRVAYLEVDVDDDALLTTAVAQGFRLVDTRMVFEVGPSFVHWDPPDRVDSLRTPTGDELPDVEAVARRAAFPSRFLRDPGFPADEAHEMYAEWVRRAHRRAPDDVLVAFAGDAPVGIAAMRSRPEGFGEHELLVVDAHHAGRGIARALLSATAEQLVARGASTVTIATQLSNLAAQRAVHHVGYGVREVRHRLHRWFD